MTRLEASFVIGTAGHVDHGKTALVRALTGVDTDRLPEEKARGISIELGFAPLVLPGVGAGSLIDVPGHERLVRAMIRGVSAIDVVLLVVAANEGVMPQTREHLTICGLLGARAVVIALTKLDLVDDDTRALAELDVAELLAASPFRDATIVPCSARTGQGLDALRTAVARAVGAAATAWRAGPAFLPVDRVFSRPGFGTIVTGTLLRGTLAVGDEVDVLTPRGVETTRVRGLQTHGRWCDPAATKLRLAVNLAATEETPLRSGAIGTRGTLRPTNAIVAMLEGALLESTAFGRQPRRGRVSLHLGVDAVEATFSTLEVPTSAGEGSASARVFLTLSRPLLAWTGDRFIVRRDTQQGPQTVGGGRVLDPHPARSRRRLRQAPVPTDEPTPARVRRIVDEAGAEGCTRSDLEARLEPGEDPRATLAEIAVALPGGRPAYVGLAALAKVEQALLARVAVLEREHPALAAHPMAVVLAGSGAPQVAAAALDRLVERGALTQREGLVATSRPGAGAGAETEAALTSLEALYRAAGLTPPSDDEALAQVAVAIARPGDLLVELRRRRVLVRVPPFHLHVDATDALIVRLRAFFEGHASLGAGDLKTLGGGLSRKYAIPLLEWLDARGITRRLGERHLPATVCPKLRR